MSRKKKRPSAAILNFEARHLEKTDPIQLPLKAAVMAARVLADDVERSDFRAASETLAELLEAMAALPLGTGRTVG